MSLILNHQQIVHKTRRIAYQLWEHNSDETEVVIAGIYENGYVFAKKIAALLEEISPLKVELCEVKMNKENPIGSVTTNKPLESFNNKSVILIDDVLHSGTTLMYGVHYFLSISLKQFKTVVLIDRNHKKYPVKADFKGISLSSSMQETVRIEFSEESKAFFV